MATLLVALQEYGINIYRQWRKIQTLLLEAEYNFEMSEHYEYCMKQGQC